MEHAIFQIFMLVGKADDGIFKSTGFVAEKDVGLCIYLFLRFWG